jgi:hypothetical protein
MTPLPRRALPYPVRRWPGKRASRARSRTPTANASGRGAGGRVRAPPPFRSAPSPAAPRIAALRAASPPRSAVRMTPGALLVD